MWYALDNRGVRSTACSHSTVQLGTDKNFLQINDIIASQRRRIQTMGNKWEIKWNRWGGPLAHASIQQSDPEYTRSPASCQENPVVKEQQLVPARQAAMLRQIPIQAISWTFPVLWVWLCHSWMFSCRVPSLPQIEPSSYLSAFCLFLIKQLSNSLHVEVGLILFSYYFTFTDWWTDWLHYTLYTLHQWKSGDVKAYFNSLSNKLMFCNYWVYFLSNSVIMHVRWNTQGQTALW